MENVAPIEKIKIRGLLRGSGWAFLLWGGLVAVKGLYDAFIGEPEANFYSLQKWEFVTKEEWLRYSGFEWAYGMACVGTALLVWRFAKRVPEIISRERPENESIF